MGSQIKNQMKIIFSIIVCLIEARRPFPPVFHAELVNLVDIDCSSVSGACTRELQPVCGSDGIHDITRSNPCVFVTEFCTNNPNLQFKLWALANRVQKKSPSRKAVSKPVIVDVRQIGQFVVLMEKTIKINVVYLLKIAKMEPMYALQVLENVRNVQSFV